jgi:putative ABC transport system permease protein
MSALLDDLRQSLKSLVRSPGFTATAALTLAVGVGITTTLTSALDTMLFRPPVAVTEPDEMVRTYFQFNSPRFGLYTNSVVSYPDFTALQRATSVSGVAAVHEGSASLGRGAEAREVSIFAVSGSYFSTLGTRPLAGRLLVESDDEPGRGAEVVVLSERFWRGRYGSDPSVIGTQVPINEGKYTIIGVTPAGFDAGGMDAPDVYAPLNTFAMKMGDGSLDYVHDQGWSFIKLLARRRTGVTNDQASAEFSAIIRAQRDTTLRAPLEQVRIGPIQEARGPDFSDSAQLMFCLAAASFLVLLISCANVGNLLFTRGLVRGRELAIRKALGAAQWRVARQLFLEGVWLALIAGAAGVLICVWVGELLRRYVLPSAMAASFTIDLRVLLIALGTSVIAAVLASLLPAFRVVRGDLTAVLKEGSSGAGFRRSRFRMGLVVAQVGLSVLLVAGAGLFIQSLRRALAIDIGYDRAQLIMVRAEPRRAGFTPEGTGQAFDAMVETALRDPAVESVALANGEPMGWSMGRSLRIAGQDSVPRMPSGGPYIQSVTGGFFGTMGLGLRRGRLFTDADRREQPLVAVIGATMAEKIFPGTDPIGKCMMIGDATTCTEVIGIVDNGIRYSPREEPQAIYYVPLPPTSGETDHLTMFVRTRGRAGDAVAPLQAALQVAVPNLPYVEARTFEEVLAPRFERFGLGARLFGLFGVLALLLAGIGIYGVLAYTVRGRQHELGVRLALGAVPARLLTMILRDGLLLALLGVIVGIAGALAAGRAIASMLYGIGAADPLILTSAGATVLLAALLAGLIPAWRATRVDPVRALRGE